jgi:tetratricopeptide (TPR) repeat protein
MLLEWFDTREATRAGCAIADRIGRQLTPRRKSPMTFQDTLKRAAADVVPPSLNIYKRAKLASSFKWRLLEIGIEEADAGEMGRILAMLLSSSHLSAAPKKAAATTPDRKSSLAMGEKCIAQGALAEAVSVLEPLVESNPHFAEAINSLGAALFKLNRYAEAEERFRQAAAIKPDYHHAHRNLGNLLRVRGLLTESEAALRTALKLSPNDLETRNSLGWTLLHLGHGRAAEACFRKILKFDPGHVDALLGMGNVIKTQGRFEDAELMFKRAQKLAPTLPSAWSSLCGVRRMTPSDSGWLDAVERICAGEISLAERADLLFAMGKYFDDLREYARAFRSYEQANALLKSTADRYDRKARTAFVDDMIRSYSRDRIAAAGGGASDSLKPVIVVGMMRSGTTLVEQIIASHPAAKGFGERGFWNEGVRAHLQEVRQGTLPMSTMQQMAQAYLKTIDRYSGGAMRVVDKAPVNADYLGLINCIFPRARIINMRRDPIDTCLSCYFQHFSAALNFTMDLSDLAHYYREHDRLIAHWRSVLPADAILDVPYEALVADQEGWTRRILDFIGLDWDERCLSFHKTNRSISSASYWQVRQPMYCDSVQRWRRYERHIAPLLGLQEL